MLFGLLSVLLVLSAIFVILLILIQKGKGSLGLGNMGGSNQMLFGGSGGQDIFQKVTWILGVIIILGSLGLAIWKTKRVGISTSVLRQPATPTRPAAPVTPPIDMPFEE